MSTYSAADLDPTWLGLVDDAAIFPPGNAELPDAIAAFERRRSEWYAGLVASLVVTDVQVPQVPAGIPVSIVVTGGAGAIPGAVRLATRAGTPVHGLETALRDLDDLPGNARRVVAAVDALRGEGALGDDVPVYVELPGAGAPAGWLAAADEVAAAELRLKFRTGGESPEAFPPAATLAGWIDAALDRETPFKCTAGLHQALRHRDPETGFEHHGFLNVLTATTLLFDGAGVAEAVRVLDETEAERVVTAARGAALERGRRWFTSFGSCSVLEPLDSLTATGLLEDR